MSRIKKNLKKDEILARDSENAGERVSAAEDKAPENGEKSSGRSETVKKDNAGKNDGKIEEMELTLPFGYKLLIVLGCIVLLVIGGWLFLNLKCRIKNIEVVGSEWYGDKEIVSAFQTTRFDEYSVFLRLHYAFFEEYPELAFVEKFKLEGKGLDGIKITVYEKKIVGCIRVMNDYMYFDKDGFLVASRIERENGVPLITGLDFSQATVNSELKVSDRSVFSSILEITQLIDKYQVPVDRLEFDEFLNVTLYCLDGNEVYLGKKTSYTDIMQALPGILEAAAGEDAKYRLDMSGFDSEHTDIPAKFIEIGGKKVDEEGNPIEETQEGEKAAENKNSDENKNSEDTGNEKTAEGESGNGDETADETYDEETYDEETYDDETYDEETYDDESYDENYSDEYDGE